MSPLRCFAFHAEYYLSAALFGAGTMEAFDGRNSTSVEKGTGGLAQVISYYAGLSGGSWLGASMAINNYPTARKLILGDVDVGGKLQGWTLDKDLLLPDGLRTPDFYE